VDDAVVVDTLAVARRLECLLLASTKFQTLMRKSDRAKMRTSEFFLDNLRVLEQYPSSEFSLGDELRQQHRDDSRKMVFDDFPELLQLLDSPPVSRPWDHPIDTNETMRRQRLNGLSHHAREELNPQ
jgi:hypothetical protein